MKTSLRLHAALAAALLLPAAAQAAPLSQTTAVQTRPDPAAPVISYLKAGSEPSPAPADPGAVAVDGWMAVSVAGPFVGFVQNSELSKALDVKPGTPVHTEPKPESPVLLVAGQHDALEITGLHGKWTQVRLDRPLIGYIRTGQAHPLTDVPPAPVEPPHTNAPGKAASHAGEPAGAGGMVRFFEGRFASAKARFFWEGTRPYDWQLLTPSGQRTAYLDLKNLLLTEQLDTFVGHDVVVHGTVRSVAGSDDLVVTVESLRLK